VSFTPLSSSQLKGFDSPLKKYLKLIIAIAVEHSIV
jgi:hypothetical protein